MIINRVSRLCRSPRFRSQFIVNLESGLGLSVINSIPEEIAYVTLTGFEVERDTLDINIC